jgi:glycerate kinase
MRVLAAFDKFRDSISAAEACDIAAAAIAAARGDCEVDLAPLTDGGEGFTQILTRAAGGAESLHAVTGPRGREARAALGLVSLDRIPVSARRLLGAAADGREGPVAIIEMAGASGLTLLAASMRDPLRATSVGTGQLIRAAGAAGARAILLGVGGSATSDLGLGALGALGIALLTASGERLGAPVPADWPSVRAIDGRVAGSVPPIVIACDVDNPLLGPRGTVSVYGPQKGLKPEDAAALEAESARMAALMCSHFGRPQSLAAVPGAGAAGGIAFGLMAAAGAVITPGFELVASWLDLDRRILAADVVITGEGRFDDSSLSGKGPGSVAARALALGKAVHVFAGSVAISREIPGLTTHAITPPGMPLGGALAEGPARLLRSVRQAAPGL